MEVLRCLLAHNRCHGLNYYHQSFTPPVKPSSQAHLIILYKERLNASLSSLARSEVSVFGCQAHQHAVFFFSFFFFPQRNTFPTHGCTSLWKGEFENICRWRKRHNKPKTSSLFLSQPHIQVYCFHVSHPTGASSPLGFMGQRHFVRDAIGRHKEKDCAAPTLGHPSLETYSEIHVYFY